MNFSFVRKSYSRWLLISSCSSAKYKDDYPVSLDCILIRQRRIFPTHWSLAVTSWGRFSYFFNCPYLREFQLGLSRRRLMRLHLILLSEYWGISATLPRAFDCSWEVRVPRASCRWHSTSWAAWQSIGRSCSGRSMRWWPFHRIARATWCFLNRWSGTMKILRFDLDGLQDFSLHFKVL